MYIHIFKKRRESIMSIRNHQSKKSHLVFIETTRRISVARNCDEMPQEQMADRSKLLAHFAQCEKCQQRMKGHNNTLAME